MLERKMKYYLPVYSRDLQLGAGGCGGKEKEIIEPLLDYVYPHSFQFQALLQSFHPFPQASFCLNIAANTKKA